MCVPRVKAKSKNCCTLPWFLLILHDDLIAQHPLLRLLIASYWLWQGKKEQVRDGKQRQWQDRDNDVGMWSGPVRGNRAKDSNLSDTRPPTWQPSRLILLKSLPAWCHPERESGDAGKRWTRARAKAGNEQRRDERPAFEMGSYESKKRGGVAEVLRGLLSSKGLLRACS